MAERNLVAALKARDEASGVFAKVEQSSSSMGATIGKVAAGIGAALAAVGVAKFGVDAVKSASDLGESMNKARVVFGAAAGDIEKFAASAANGLGLSKAAALGAAGTFGNLFDQMKIGAPVSARMSKELISLSADLASFHNSDITSVIEAQTAAFRGEFDSLQKYIPTLNAAAVQQRALEMTGKKTTDALTEQDKVLATHQLMMEGAGKAQGDFASTSNSLANVQRRLGALWENFVADVGGKILPAIEPLAAWFADVLPKGLDLASKGITAITDTVRALISGQGFDKLYEGFINVFGEGMAARLAAFIDPLARVRVTVGEVITGLIADTENAQEPLVDRIGRWTAGFIDWVPKAAAGMLPKLTELLNGMVEWIHTQSGPLTEKFLAEWVPAALVWVVKAGFKLTTETLPNMLKDIGAWVITTGVPKLIEGTASLGGAIVSGTVRGIANLGGQIWDAIMAWVPSWDDVKAAVWSTASPQGRAGVAGGGSRYTTQSTRTGMPTVRTSAEGVLIKKFGASAFGNTVDEQYRNAGAMLQSQTAFMIADTIATDDRRIAGLRQAEAASLAAEVRRGEQEAARRRARRERELLQYASRRLTAIASDQIEDRLGNIAGTGTPSAKLQELLDLMRTLLTRDAEVRIDGHLAGMALNAAGIRAGIRSFQMGGGYSAY